MKVSSYQRAIDLTVRKGGIEMVRKFFKPYWADEDLATDFFVRHLKDYFPEEITFLLSDKLDGGNL